MALAAAFYDLRCFSTAQHSTVQHKQPKAQHKQAESPTNLSGSEEMEGHSGGFAMYPGVVKEYLETGKTLGPDGFAEVEASSGPALGLFSALP